MDVNEVFAREIESVRSGGADGELARFNAEFEQQQREFERQSAETDRFISGMFKFMKIAVPVMLAVIITGWIVMAVIGIHFLGKVW